MFRCDDPVRFRFDIHIPVNDVSKLWEADEYPYISRHEVVALLALLALHIITPPAVSARAQIIVLLFAVK